MSNRRQFLQISMGGIVGMAMPPRLLAKRTPAWSAGPALPYAVQEIYLTAHAGHVHLAGGLIAANGQVAGVTARHIMMIPGRKEWMEAAPLPEPRHHPHLVGVDRGVLCLGGFASRSAEGLDWTMVDDTLLYDPASDEWEVKSPAPEVHGETVCLPLNGKVHVLCGRTPTSESNKIWQDHTDSSRHLIYDPASDKWETGAPVPTARNSAAGAVIEGKLYLVAGRTVSGGNQTATEIYDPKEDKWRSGTPMPQGQGGLAAGVLNGELYAFGGEYFNDGGGVYPECWIYHPKADQWRAGPAMVTPRHGLGGVTLDGRIFAIGGATKAGGQGTSPTLEILS